MRDNEIIRNQAIQSKKIAGIYKQMVFLDCRAQAIDAVLQSSSFFDRLHWLFWPADFVASVDAVQLKLMQDHDEKLAAAVQAKMQPSIVKPSEAQTFEVVHGR